METVNEPSKDIVRGSLFGKATIGLDSLANRVVGVDPVLEYKEALDGISHLYSDGNLDSLSNLINGLAPEGGMDATDVPKHQRFCKAVQEIKDRAREKGVPLELGCLAAEDRIGPEWYVDVTSPETEVFEIKLTPYGRKICSIVGRQGIYLDKDATDATVNPD